MKLIELIISKKVKPDDIGILRPDPNTEVEPTFMNDGVVNISYYKNGKKRILCTHISNILLVSEEN